MHEVTVAFLAADLLDTVMTLHAALALHADLRPDNVSLRGGLAQARALDASVSLTASNGGWGAHGIALLDFGRGIDRKLYDKATRFSGDVLADGFECLEMRRGECWVAQVDLYATAATICSLLTIDSDKPMQLHGHPRKGRCTAKLAHLDDLEAQGLWENLFDVLINDGTLPEQRAVIKALTQLADASVSSRRTLKAELIKMHQWLGEDQLTGEAASATSSTTSMALAGCDTGALWNLPLLYRQRKLTNAEVGE